MKLLNVVALSLSLSAIPVGLVQAQQNDSVGQVISALPWKTSGTGSIASRASIAITPAVQFLDSVPTRRFLELNGNPPRDNQFTLAQRDLSWFAVFAYDDSGHVLDKEAIDADALLTQLMAGNRRSVEERKRLGFEPLHLEGWSVPPHYDLETKRLEWGTRFRTDGGDEVVNYTTRILGRTGVMSATLVSTPGDFDKDVRSFKAALRGFSYVPGETYAEYRQGDRLAEYGLGALIVGGAVAKTGALKGLGKLVGVGLIALVGGLAAFGRAALRRST
jgi:uncharacterized membrane-anchored protein